MSIKFYRNTEFTGDEFIKIDEDNGIEYWFQKSLDTELAAELDNYEQANGAVTETYSPPAPPPPTHGDLLSQLGLEPEELLAAIKYAEAHVEHGAWDAAKQYHINDVVTHNGFVWRATSNNSNNEPDDVPGDWEKVS